MARKKDATEREVNELLDSLLEGRSPEEIMGGGGLLEALTSRHAPRVQRDHLLVESRGTSISNSDVSGFTRFRVRPLRELPPLRPSLACFS